jgi:hypothetical protein
MNKCSVRLGEPRQNGNVDGFDQITVSRLALLVMTSIRPAVPSGTSWRLSKGLNNGTMVKHSVLSCASTCSPVRKNRSAISRNIASPRPDTKPPMVNPAGLEGTQRKSSPMRWRSAIKLTQFARQDWGRTPMKWIAFSIAVGLTLAAVSSTPRAASVAPLSAGWSADTASATRVYYYYKPYYYQPYYYYRPYYYYCHRYYSWGYLYCAW